MNSFAAYLQHTSERERAAVARELHNEVGGVLAAAKIELDVIGRSIPEGAAEVHDRLRRLANALDAGLAVERGLVERLRPSVLDHLGLYVALRWQTTEQCKRTGSECAFAVRGAEPNYLPDTAISVLRTVDDAVAYALARGGTTTVEVELRIINECLEVLVQDNGTYVSDGLEAGDGRVLIWAAGQRAGILGGECLVSPRPVNGTRILLRIPVANLERPMEWSAGE